MVKSQTICLNMIVKNEAPVIRRCLDSLAGFIDSWVIVDTGSTDGTQQIVREHLAHLPGELIERPWLDFAHNRTEALALARGRADYVLVIDADEVLSFESGFSRPVLDRDAYHFAIRTGGVSYFKIQLIDNSLPWSYQGVLHEFISSAEARTEAVLPGVTTLRFPDGARARDPLTYRRDALTLERALLDEPDNARYVFYLAQSYRDAGEPELAIRWYRRRIELGGWLEEVWYSEYQIAEIRQKRGDPWPEVLDAYLEAHRTKPDRAGPLYKIGMHYQALQHHTLAHVFLAQAMRIPFPAKDVLFIEHAIYRFMLPLEYAIAAYYCGDDVAALETNNRLLLDPDLPPEVVLRAEANRVFSLDRLRPKLSSAADEARRVVVIVAVRDCGPWLDDCIESLLEQSFANFLAVFVDDGSRDDAAGKLPEDERFVWQRHDRPLGLLRAMSDALAAHAAADDLVLCLDGRDALDGAGALRTAVQSLAERGSEALYGQHVFSTGQRGVAVPVARPEAFRRLPDLRPPIEPIVVRARHIPRAEALVGHGPDDWAALGYAALAAAGFERSHFNNRTLVVVNLEARRAIDQTEAAQIDSAAAAAGA